MANAVFTTKAQPVYDDLPEVRYHFPQTYLNQATQAIGDFIVYYEPRREGSNLAGRGGRQVYFAAARLDGIEEDPNRRGYFYGFVSEYLEFPTPVPFRLGRNYFESSLRKPDGSTNKGAFGRSVRTVPSAEFQMILTAGFTEAEPARTLSTAIVEETPPPFGRPLRTVISERPFRDAAFTRVIQNQYRGACAMTGVHLTDEGGHLEIEAAHIRPVAAEGPDSPRNGIALCRTVHWMFDAGILSISDEGQILMATRLVPDKVRGVLNTDRPVQWPLDPSMRPHPQFLRYHRERIFKGN